MGFNSGFQNASFLNMEISAERDKLHDFFDKNLEYLSKEVF